MDCRELQPSEVITDRDYYQTKYGGDNLFPVLYSASMTVAEALAKWPHITAFYRATARTNAENT